MIQKEIYQQKIGSTVKPLLFNDIIEDFEVDIRTERNYTPVSYCLPKIHKHFVRISEFVNSFLKLAAQKTITYLRDTTDSDTDKLT